MNPFEIMQIGELDDMVSKLDEQVAALRELKNEYKTLVDHFVGIKDGYGTLVENFDVSGKRTEAVITNLGLLITNSESIAASAEKSNLLAEHQIALKIAPRIRIYEYATAPANDSIKLFEKKIDTEESGSWSTDFMFIITHVANSTGRAGEIGGWYDNTKATWKRDYNVAFKARYAEEEIEYQYSKIDNPVELTPWIPIFYNHKWTVQNENAFAVVAEVLMQGFIFPTRLWDEATARFFRTRKITNTKELHPDKKF